MTFVLIPNWGIWLAAVLAFAAGVLVIRWALFADRSRGRRRCPACWYDMSGTPGLMCSECGYEAAWERRLHRPRRHWKWSAAGGFLLLGIPAASIGETVRHRGWLASMPNVALIIAMPCADDVSNPFGEELLRRAAARDSVSAKSGDLLWDWQWRWLLTRAIDKSTNLQPNREREPDRALASLSLSDQKTFARLVGRDVYDRIVVEAVRNGKLESLDLVDDLARQRPVFVEVGSLALMEGRTDCSIELLAQPTFPALKYRVTVDPDVSWLRGTVQTAEGYQTMHTLTNAAPSAPPGVHQVEFAVTVEYAPLGIYGSYGPEEFAVYDEFTLTRDVVVRRPG